MEFRFGRDLSTVRVHTGARAAESAHAVSALAYTVGREVVFAADQYRPLTPQGQRLLTHEITHAVQQGMKPHGSGPLSLGGPGDRYEEEASRAASQPSTERPIEIELGSARHLGRTVQRFSESEHREIGKEAYERALPQDTGAASGPQPEPLDPGLVKSLREFKYRHATGAVSSYGDLVTMADNVASFQLMEDNDRDRAHGAVRIPVLSRIWDMVGDEAHYLDLAARNRAHFHPHNFMAWQSYHWSALGNMDQAAKLEAEADRLNIEIKQLLTKFDQLHKRGLDIFKQLDTTDTQSKESETLTNEINALMKEMSAILAAAAEKQKKVAELREQARPQAVHAMAVNGFGDHFLTDAYAGGHIVTPRADLLDGYTTKFLGLLNVGGVLGCANVPSLAWHDLDNKFGVRVKNRKGTVWTTYGDNYLDHDAPKLEPTTKQMVVEATTRSVRQMWEAAAGRKPQTLTDVLDLLPAPILDPAVYPAWTPQDWDLQLRYAAGEAVGADYGDVQKAPLGEEQPKRPQVPNPKGNVIGVIPPLSARATCLNLTSIFSYDKFVVPMLERIRREYNQRFYVGGAGQIVAPGETPKSQASVVGHTVIGSIIGLLAGIGIGFLAGGPIGAAIGGLVGLFGGGLIGGLIGKERK